MANAKPVALCPKCHNELPSPMPAVCPDPNCRHILERPKNQHFGSPDYLAYQLDDKLEKFTTPSRDKPKTPAEMDEEADIQSAFRQWGKDAPLGDRIAAMRDAHHLLSWVLHADLTEAGSDEVLAGLSRLARQIGELGKAIDLYFTNGGASGVTVVRSVHTRRVDPSRGSEATS